MTNHYSPISVYKVDGKIFETEAALIEYLEGKVHDLVRSLISSSKGKITLADTVIITDFILNHRHKFVSLLDYSIDKDCDL